MGNFVVLIFLLIIAIIDIKKKIIHNKTSLLTLLIGLFLYKKIYLTGLLVATLILIICIFIDENYKGGGDIKFIGVIGLLKGFNFTIEFYIISELLVATLILIICIFIDENYKGGGDIKFIGVIGLLKGFNFTIEFYIISEILCVIYRKITKKYKKEEIAYAPFMFLSFLIKTIFL